VIRQAEMLKGLGVKTTKALPASLVDGSGLEEGDDPPSGGRARGAVAGATDNRHRCSIRRRTKTPRPEAGRQAARRATRASQ
jgi:hypothetical protein